MSQKLGIKVFNTQAPKQTAAMEAFLAEGHHIVSISTAAAAAGSDPGTRMAWNFVTIAYVEIAQEQDKTPAADDAISADKEPATEETADADTTGATEQTEA